MTYLPEIKNEMEKVLHALHKNRKLLIYPKTTGFSDTTINAENLEDVAGNHLFDDHPQFFGITEMSGHKIRAYFQEGCVTYDFVKALHQEFPKLLETERKKYLDKINKRRESKDLEPIEF